MNAHHTADVAQPTAEPTDNRPPGGTRRTGNKTPGRKVQWAERGLRAEPLPSTHELDEHALDPDAFRELAHALERHRSVTTAEPANHYFVPSHDPFTSQAPTAITPGTSLPSSPEMRPTHDVPGEVYIDEHETAGLPGRDIEQYSNQQAEKVVRAHRYGFFKGLGHSRGHRRSSTDERAHLAATPDAHKSGFLGKLFGASHKKDVEKTAEASTAHSPPKRPMGVLSTLLSLYDPHGPAASTLSTPSRASFDDGPHAVTAPRPSYQPSLANPSTTSLRPPMHPWTMTLPLNESRPPAARSGAGVFGALVASTANITGAATPQLSTVAPNVNRPGYHLSRYSFDGALPKTEKRVPYQRQKSASFDSPALRLNTNVSGTTDSASPEEVSSAQSAATSSPASSIPTPAPTPGGGRQKWTGVIKDLPKWGLASLSRVATPMPGTPMTDVTGSDEWAGEKAQTSEERRDRRKRKKAEIWITRHVAEIVARQEFILKLARAMMMFGGPTHRLQAQIMATAKVLDISLSCMYLPDVMLISFDDASTSTSNIKLIRQSSALSIAKLQEAHELYWKVIHDEISVKDASVDLDELMCRPPRYQNWQIVLFGGLCSASICSVSFNGSFIDCLISFPLGCLLIFIQIFASRNELYSNVFEITVATAFSFIAAALASVKFFCYSAIAASSVVLILPGFIILCGSLELASRNIVAGSVRVCFSLIYSLFLGFGLAIGATAYSRLTHVRLAGPDDLTCGQSHDPNGPWWQRTPSLWWAFLTVPLFSLAISLRNHAPWNRRELPLLVMISSIGWVSNHFTGTKFPNQSDISAAVGALAVGFVANLYGRFFGGNAFVVMITGILFQLPSGLANGGLFTFVSDQESGSATAYLSGFRTALQLVSVSIGLTVGLGISLVAVHPIPSRRRAGAMFSL